ncbi:MAG: patatin-like phospholipase family protein [Actinobacteria bacterium]|nr:patatin-like phospholipase family protein [Actinomycetota bacterium]
MAATDDSSSVPGDSSLSAGGRRAIVCGGGGLLGFAWTLGALGVIEQQLGFDARDCEVVLGTSAGAVIASLLGCGLSISQISRHHQGCAGKGDPPIDWDYDTAAGRTRPQWPRWWPGSPRLLASAVRHPRDLHPMVALSGVLPAGRGDLRPMHDVVVAVAHDAGFDLRWPERPRPWIAVTDFREGRRVVFGRDRSAPLADAVIASCAIPAWYSPVVVGDRRYVDGGAVSNTSLDLLAGEGYDEVYVVAPMAMQRVSDRWYASPLTRVERAVRVGITRRLMRDVRAVSATGTKVVVIRPGEQDLAAIGLNLMNSGRRLQVLDVAARTVPAQLRDQLRRIGVAPESRRPATERDSA